MIILKILGIAAIVVAALFVLTFVVYFFNLDMKLTAALEPIFLKQFRRPCRFPDLSLRGCQD